MLDPTGKDEWVELSMRLSFVSRLKLMCAAIPSWPPETPVAFGVEDGRLYFDYIEDVDEVRMGLPHALWRATYLEKRDAWWIVRIRDI